MNVCAGAASRRLWLVRHGESTWNTLGLLQGQADGPQLTRAGVRQARACAHLLEGEPVVALYASDLERAARTALPIAESLKVDVVHDARLRERSLGEAEGLPTAHLGPEDSGVVGGRVADADAAPAGGESIRELYERVAACLVDVLAAHPIGDIVLVCHGGVVRVAEAWLDGTPADEMTWPEVANGRPVLRPLSVPTPA